MEGEDPKGLSPITARAGAEAGAGAPGAPPEVPGPSDCGPIGGFSGSQLSGGAAAAGGAPSVVDKAEVSVVGVKRKRGRPPKNQGKQQPPPPKKKPKEDEDVCFICFDGGSLVLCDRRDCPKAYHPACIKRDEAFFNTRAKWNCGWHICSSCQKASHYMCYTCTFSLCKACTKDSDYLCVRENKGFCTTCMGTIMLIEKKDQGNKEAAHVDFDDKTSWEYLFKVYWVYLKEKLSLTFEELTQAKNPWKEAAAAAVHKVHPLDIHSSPSNGNTSALAKPSGDPVAYNLREKRTKGCSDLPQTGDSPSTDQSVCDNGYPNFESADWASKELLGFVAHMKNGDLSELSQFDVQTLLLDYIKKNNLRDPRRKSQIICDSRLINLFGKERVGHFEMLKLLEFHFTTKENHQKDVTQGTNDASVSQAECNGNSDSLLMTGKHKKRKSRTKGEDRGIQENLDDYAAIDVHNINLIYLRRNLMENLVKEIEQFHEKVVGSIVRIRIPCSDQKQNMHRLVLVAGTCKAAEPYKIGEVTSDIMLEILNLNKKETIAIDAISNQEFSEDECRRLRQSIKYGLVKRLTVGQVQEKAIVLQEVRLNDWLEAELIRLNHLRDRASEKGQKKQLRECVEKIELLKSPEERKRRLQVVPEIHVDPNCESDEDDGLINNKKRDGCATPRYHEDVRNGREPPSMQNGNLSTGIDIKKLGSDTSVKPVKQVDSAGSVAVGRTRRLVLRSASSHGVGSETSVASHSTGCAPAVTDNETEMLWHYRDPNGKVQGPFCMIQLRKWSTTGYFPLDMRVWSVNDKETDSLLMTDLLNGKVKKVSPQQHAISSSQVVRGVSDATTQPREGGVAGIMKSTKVEGNGAAAHSNGTHGVVNAIENASQCQDLLKVGSSPSEQVQCAATSSPVPEQSGETSLNQVKINEGQNQSSVTSNEHNVHGNVISHFTGGQNHDNQSNNQEHPEVASAPKPSGSREQEVGNDFPNLPSPTPNANSRDLNGEAPKEQEQLPSKVAGQNLITPNLNSPIQKSSEEDEKFEGGIQNIASPATLSTNEDEKAVASIQNVPSPSLKQTNDNEKAEASTQDVRSPMPKSRNEDGKAESDIQSIQNPIVNSTSEDEKAEAGIQNASIPTPPKCTSEDEKTEASIRSEPTPTAKSTNEDEKVEVSENKYFISNFPAQHSESSWSNTSNLGQWGGYSSAGTKPSLEEWNAGLVLSSLKPPAAANSAHASTPISSCDEPTPSPSHHASNTSNWQAMVAEPIEFSTLAEESVSDLLAEVDAMESQREFASSPTSRMTCIEELFEYSKSDYFNSFGGLSPPLESGKSDSSCSTGDLQLPLQLTLTSQPIEVPQSDVSDPEKKNARESSSKMEMDAETKPIYTSQHEPEACLTRQLLAPCTVSGGMADLCVNPTNIGSRTMHGNLSPLQGGSSSQGVTDMGCSVSRGMTDLGANPRMMHENTSPQREGLSTRRLANMECTGNSGIPDLGANLNEVGSRAMSEHMGSPRQRGSSTRGVANLGCTVSSGMTDLRASPSDFGSRMMIEHTNSRHGGSSAQGIANLGCTVSSGMTDLGPSPLDVNVGSRTMHGHMSPRRGGSSSTQGNANMGWLTGHGGSGGSANTSRSPSAGFVRREERHAGHRDRAHRSGGDSGFGRERPSWSRQSAFVGGNTGGGSYPRQSPRGQRVCKFYESGYCRKGAFCDYLHPS